MVKFKDILVENSNLKLEEVSEVNGNKNIIGRVKGRFFVPGGESRNGRYYPQEVWDKQLDSDVIKNKLNNRSMLGTIGHNTELTEETLLEGKISHIVNELYIDSKGQGIGEALILNSPAGNVLKTLLGAGSKIYVSSRADGTYRADKFNGLDVVDPETYELHTFDFVLDPGFLEANPVLVESIKSDLYETGILKKERKENKQNGGNVMEDTNVQSVISSLKDTLDRTNTELTKNIEETADVKATNSLLQAEKDKLVAENNQLKIRLEAAYKTSNELKESSEKLKKSLNKANELNRRYKEYGNIGEIKKGYNQLSRYSKFGSVNKLGKTLNLYYNATNKYKEYGDLKEIKEGFNLLSQYIKLGKPSLIRKQLQERRKYRQYGNFNELEKGLKEISKSKKTSNILEKYKKLGTTKELSAVCNHLEKQHKSNVRSEKKNVIESLASRYNANQRDIADWIRKGLTERQIINMYEKVKESNSDISHFKNTSTGDNKKAISPLEKEFSNVRDAEKIMERYYEKSAPKTVTVTTLNPNQV